ncbi:MAG: sulfatase-like hydrolase/transferase [Bacteroidales bacterium]|nr:sulfatase-like hydrolase/transferase [Bacteroidales bacterium]
MKSNSLLYSVRSFLLILIALSGSLKPQCLIAQKISKPNVIIFLMDDMGYGDVKIMNPEGCGFNTPNLDQLARDGVYFSQAHSADALCATTRYSLLTGNHVYRGRKTEGTWDNLTKSQIMPGQKTLADILRAQGYVTAFFGKSHLGGEFLKADGTVAGNYDEADLSRRFIDGPIEHGFDYSLTLPGGIQESPYAFFKNDRLARWDKDLKEFVHFDQDDNARIHFTKFYNKDINLDEFMMDNWTTESVGPLLMRDALGFIDSHIEKHGTTIPFYMHYCSQAGHVPYVPPLAFNINEPTDTEDLSKVGALPVKGQTVNIRTDMMYEGDLAMGLFIEKLRKKGILENTLIIFSSDNGAAAGINQEWSNPIYETPREGKFGGNRTETGTNRKDLMHTNAQGVAKGGSPLRGEKGFVYEGGHRVPLIFRWGNGIPSGYVVEDQLISLHDIFRTVASIVDVSPGPESGLDSYDFSAILRQPDIPHDPVREYLFIQSNEQNIERTTIKWAAFQQTKGNKDPDVWKAIINIPRTLYGKDFPDMLDKAKAIELYYLSDDPSESNNMLHSDKLKELEMKFKSELNLSRTAK